MRECGAEALDNKVEFGVWGGMTERQRRALLKQNPGVASWTEFFDKRNAGSVGQRLGAPLKAKG
jgi:WhiB family redox-sensing transcriptional regulator